MNDLKLMIEQPTKAILKEYSKISIAFPINTIFKLEPINSGLGGIKFIEEPVNSRIKNYDSPTENPNTLINEFDLKNWVIISAFKAEKRIGGAIIAYDTKDVFMLEGRNDIAVLWDLRLNEEFRGKGIGQKILKKCIAWAKSKNCSRLKIETQNNNTKACKFYAKNGAILTNINKNQYKDYPDEIQLIWTIHLKN